MPAAAPGCRAGCGRARRPPVAGLGEPVVATVRRLLRVRRRVVGERRLGADLRLRLRLGLRLGLRLRGSGPGCRAVSSITLTSGATSSPPMTSKPSSVASPSSVTSPASRYAGRSVREIRTRPSRITRSGLSGPSATSMRIVRTSVSERSAQVVTDEPSTVTVSAGGGEHRGGGAAQDDLGLAVGLADQDEAGQVAQPVGDERVEHLVEAGTGVDQRPQAGHPGLLRRRQHHGGLVAEDAEPVTGSVRPGIAHCGGAPNLSSRLTRCRSES